MMGDDDVDEKIFKLRKRREFGWGDKESSRIGKGGDMDDGVGKIEEEILWYAVPNLHDRWIIF